MTKQSLFNLCTLEQLEDLGNMGMEFIISNGEITYCKTNAKNKNNIEKALTSTTIYGKM